VVTDPAGPSPVERDVHGDDDVGGTHLFLLERVGPRDGDGEAGGVGGRLGRGRCVGGGRRPRAFERRPQEERRIGEGRDPGGCDDEDAGGRKEAEIKEAEEALASAEKQAAEKRKLVEQREAEAKAASIEAERERIDVIIRRAYLRTVGRPPEAEELTASKKYFAESGDIGVATRDLMWALLNTKEFSLNH
jgi:hypothetical protein